MLLFSFQIDPAHFIESPEPSPLEDILVYLAPNRPDRQIPVMLIHSLIVQMHTSQREEMNVSKEDFEMTEKGLFCGMNKPKDVAKMTDMEKKHMPVIECPDSVKSGEPFIVSIKVGDIPHVMEEAHHVQWIDVYFGSNFNERVELTPVFTRPEITLTLVKGGKHRTATLRVIERCNLHGQWEADKEIIVTE
jgi:superoxide reductase